MTKFINIFLFILLCNNSFAQETSVSYSFGGIYSDLDLSMFDKSFEESIGRKLNTGKHNVYTSIGLRHNFAKIVKLEFNLTYQERLPLEYFTFRIDDGFSVSSHSFSGVPTSRQSTLWNPDRWLRLPNFNYLHMEFIPMVQLKKKVKFSAGVGIFYGILLNQKEVVFGRESFPDLESNFEPPTNVKGEVSYRKHDFGWIPKLAIGVPLSEKIELGFSFKTYISQIALLRNNIAGSEFLIRRRYNNTWLVFAYGLEVSYLLNRKGAGDN